MYYIDALKLLNTCVEHKILHENGKDIAVYKNSTNTSKEVWYLVPKDVLAQKLMKDEEGQAHLIAALNKANIKFEPDYPNNKPETINETYILVWYEEEEEWYYFKDSFDSTMFPCGYADYEIGVEDGYITYDTYNRDNLGKKFEDVYDKSLWDNE